MNTTAEQRTPRIKLQTHGHKLVKQNNGEFVAVPCIAYRKHYFHVTALRAALERAGHPRVRKNKLGVTRQAGWWVHRIDRGRTR